MDGLRSFALTAPIWIVLVILGWWWWIDYQPWNPFGGVPSSNYTAQVLTPNVGVNGTVQIQVKYNIHRDDCGREVQVWQGNSVERLLFAHKGATSGQGNGPRSRIHEYKASAHVGQEYIRFRTVWSCNPLRSWNENWEPVYYEVVER